MLSMKTALSNAGIAVRRVKRLARSADRVERSVASMLRAEGCSPPCGACALGIHDVESGKCPCCGEIVE